MPYSQSDHEENPDPVDAALSGDKDAYADAARLLRARSENIRQMAGDNTLRFGVRVQKFMDERARVDSGTAGFLESWLRAVPPNRLEDGLRFVAATRWPIVWVPRMEIVSRLLDAPDSDRSSTLAASRYEVLDDCSSAIRAGRADRYEELAPFVESAISALRDGHVAPAQALGASLLTTIVEHHLGYRKLGEAQESLEVDPREADFDSIRIALIAGCVPDALASFWPSRGDPVPATFNRHASLHRVCTDQYTEENALVSLMLVSAFLRELSELERSGRWSPEPPERSCCLMSKPPPGLVRCLT